MEAIIMAKMDKQNVVYTYNRILLSLKKEGDFEIYYNIGKLVDILQSEISQSQKHKYCDSTNMGYLE